jgi:D-methionine transport system substrate-binding protein
MNSLKFLQILLIASFFTGCKGCLKTSDIPPDKTKITVGVMAGPEEKIWEKIKEVAKIKQGLDINLVIFNDYMSPNTALNESSIDANAFQHEPFLNQMVHDRKLDIISVAKTFIFPLAAYSKKISSLSELKQGAKVAIPNDPTNEGRALLLLQKENLIKLRDPTKLLSTPSDIIKNPLGLKIIEFEAAQLPLALQDIDLAIINTTFSQAARLNANKEALTYESSDSSYVNVIAVRTADKDALWAKKLALAVQNQEVMNEANAIFGGAVQPGWR